MSGKRTPPPRSKPAQRLIAARLQSEASPAYPRLVRDEEPASRVTATPTRPRRPTEPPAAHAFWEQPERWDGLS